MVKIKLTNFLDRENAKAGLLPEAAIRSIEIEALADTGAISAAGGLEPPRLWPAYG